MKDKTFVYYLNETCTLAGSAMFILLTCICFMQVILRYFFNAAQEWPEEASRFLFIWIAYLGMAYSMYSKGHLKVDVIYLVVSKTTEKHLNIFAYFVSLLFMGIVAREGWKMLDIVIESEEVALTLPIPLYLIWFSIPFTFALTGLYCLHNMYACISDEKKKD